MIYQFYTDDDKKRQEELKSCLKYNCINENIDNIYLINDREHTEYELGLSSKKIIQIISGSRLTYKLML